MTGTVHILPASLRKLRDQFPHLPRALGLVWEAARTWTLVWFGLLVIQALLPVALVYITRALVNDLVVTINAGSELQMVRPVLVDVTLLAGILLFMEITRGLAAWIRTVQAELVQDHVNERIHEKSVAVDLAFYETPEYYDRLHRARAEASYRPVELIQSVGSLLQNSLTLIAMAGVLIPYGLWLPVALLISSLPAVLVVLHYSVREHEWRKQNTPDERRAWYYDWLLTAGDVAAELRAFELGPRFRLVYRTLREGLRRARLQLVRDRSAAELGAGTFGLVTTGLAMAWMVLRALRGEVTLGDLALFYQAFSQGQRLMRTLLENAGQVYGSVLFLSDLFEFLELEPRVTSPSQPLPVPTALTKGIRFDGVAFRYPGSAKMALYDFDLFVPADSTIALVGPNGAGKSTVIKLLCRLYDPDEGRITLDGVDLREVDPRELRSRMSMLFQDPVRYNATAGENISLGEWATSPSNERVVIAAHASGADRVIANLPETYNTLLGRWFDGGAELSVGEWQRIALARALLRESTILCLDEPTSAMDSWAERDWLQGLRTLTRGRTVIVITHRLSTAMYSDIVHVMVEGRIAESGRHADLASGEGLYAASWRTHSRETAERGHDFKKLDS